MEKDVASLSDGQKKCISLLRLNFTESKIWYLDEPFVFLDEENACSIYDVRPKACREFPHTDRKKIYQIANLTQKNMSICPAAFEIVEKMKKQLVGVK